MQLLSEPDPNHGVLVSRGSLGSYGGLLWSGIFSLEPCLDILKLSLRLTFPGLWRLSGGGHVASPFR